MAARIAALIGQGRLRICLLEAIDPKWQHAAATGTQDVYASGRKPSWAYQL